MGSKKRFFGAEETGRSGRTESTAPTGAGEDRRLYRCVATAPRPSSVCFADTFPGGEGNPLRRGWADRVVHPYGCGGRSEVVTMYCCCSQTLIRLLRRHLPRRGRQSAAAGEGRTGSSAPTRCGGRSEVVTMYCCCSQTLIRLLRRHLPRRGRQSAAAEKATSRHAAKAPGVCWFYAIFMNKYTKREKAGLRQAAASAAAEVRRECGSGFAVRCGSVRQTAARLTAEADARRR